jgi:hypothetical protein
MAIQIKNDMQILLYFFLVVIPLTQPLNDPASNRSPTECILKPDLNMNYLKEFVIDGKKARNNKVEYSYVFAKNTNYSIKLCPANGLIVTLYDSQRNKIISSRATSTVEHQILFQCESTGIYYMEYTFEVEGINAQSLLSFGRQQTVLSDL